MLRQKGDREGRKTGWLRGKAAQGCENETPQRAGDKSEGTAGSGTIPETERKMRRQIFIHGDERDEKVS